MILPSIILFLMCVALSAFFNGAETAFISVNPYSVENLGKKGSRSARVVKRVLSKINEFLATILIGNTLVAAVAASIATSLFSSLFPGKNKAIIHASVTTTIFILLFSELTPKIYASQNQLKTAIFTVYPIKTLMVLFLPLAKGVSFITRLFLPSSQEKSLSGTTTLSEDELTLMLRAGADDLPALRKMMITGALDIASRPVREIMVPRPEVKAIPVDSTLEDIINTVQTFRFSRYPVYRGRLDNIEGLIHAKDLLILLKDANRPQFDLKSIMQPAFFIPESASIEDAMLQMQSRAVQLAFVVDEFGSVDGIVTLEDIIEELVGEIHDEHETAVKDTIRVLPGPKYLVEGSASVKQLNLMLSRVFPEKAGYSTVAGFVLSQFGRLPREKEYIYFAGYRLTVEKMSKRRINLVSIEPEKPVDSDKA